MVSDALRAAAVDWVRFSSEVCPWPVLWSGAGVLVEIDRCRPFDIPRPEWCTRVVGVYDDVFPVTLVEFGHREESGLLLHPAVISIEEPVADVVTCCVKDRIDGRGVGYIFVADVVGSRCQTQVEAGVYSRTINVRLAR